MSFQTMTRPLRVLLVMADAATTVTIDVPARAEYVAVLRAAAGVIASRLDWSLDDIDDLRILIDEAASILLNAGAQGVLHGEIDNSDESIDLRLTAVTGNAEFEENGFAWTVLRALANEVATSSAAGRQTITVTRRRGVIDATP